MNAGWYCIVGLQNDRSWWVSTKDNAERDLVLASTEFCVVGIRRWVLKCISAFSMFGDVVSKRHNNSLIECLGLVVRLSMIRYCCLLFNIKEGTHCSNEFTDELSSILSENGRREVVRKERMIKDEIRSVRCCCLGRWGSSSQIGISGGNENYVLNTLCCFGSWFYNIHCDKVEWYGCWVNVPF